MTGAVAAVVVSVAGRIGPLHVGRSGRAAIVAFAGRPDAEGRGHRPSSSPYRSLGYGCARRFSASLFQVALGGPYCRTVFFLDAPTGRLVVFFTSSPRYVEAHGVRIGMRTAEAERRAHALAYGGCTDAIRLRGTGTSLTIPIDGGTYRRLRSGALHVVGGRVHAFVLHGADRTGVFDCW